MNDLQQPLTEWIKLLTHMEHWSKSDDSSVVLSKLMDEGLRLDVPTDWLPYSADHYEIEAKRKALEQILNQEAYDTIDSWCKEAA